MSKIGDVQISHGAAYEIEVWNRRGFYGLFKSAYLLVYEIRDAFSRMRKTNDGVEISRSEVNINQKRLIPSLREQNTEIAGNEAFTGTSLPASNGPYVRHSFSQQFSSDG